MTTPDILDELSKLGTESCKKVLMRHGAREPFFGVLVSKLKTIQKRIKQDYKLSLALFDTGNSDAMYLAGLIADPAQMKKTDLKRWMKNAYWSMLSECTVAWVAAESRFGWELALEWIDSKKDSVTAGGWATLSSLMSITPDDQLDLPALTRLLDRVSKNIHSSGNQVRGAMNTFVIASGCFVKPLTPRAKAVAKAIGRVAVDQGETSCQVPVASDYIAKVEAMGRLGKKKKTARC